MFLLGWPAIARFMISCRRSVSVATRAAAVLRSADVFDGPSAWSNALLRLAANSSDQVCKRADCAAHRGQQAETEREHHHADHRSDGGARNSEREKKIAKVIQLLEGRLASRVSRSPFPAPRKRGIFPPKEFLGPVSEMSS